MLFPQSWILIQYPYPIDSVIASIQLLLPGKAGCGPRSPRCHFSAATPQTNTGQNLFLSIGSMMIYSIWRVYIYIYGGFLKWGTPKSSIFKGLSMINHPFWVPLFLASPVCITSYIGGWHPGNFDRLPPEMSLVDVVATRLSTVPDSGPTIKTSLVPDKKLYPVESPQSLVSKTQIQRLGYQQPVFGIGTQASCCPCTLSRRQGMEKLGWSSWTEFTTG